MRPVIGLADLATALQTLDARDDTVARVVRLLDLAATADRRRPVVGPAASPSSTAEVPAAVDTPRQESAPARSSASPRPLTDRARMGLVITPLDSAPIEQPRWPAPLGAPPRRRTRASLPFSPLFEPRLTPAILVGVCRTWRRDGVVDAMAMADLIARRRPAQRVRRHLQPTLRMGAEVLIDRGEGMALFLPDIEFLVAAFTRVVGRTVAVRSFDETPLVAGAGPRYTWVEYQPPAAGTPVLAVTDFGIANPSGSVADDWLTLSDRLRRADCPFAALVPWPADRHPRDLVRAIPTLVWDRATTPASLRELRRARTRR